MALKLRALACSLLPLAVSSYARADVVDCHVGSYRFQDGTTVDIAPESDGVLRWRRFDGETGELHKTADDTWTSTLGWTGRDDGKRVVFSCSAGTIDFNDTTGQRMVFDVQDVTFTSHGTKLVGRLVMPVGQNKVPVVVQVHGAEHVSALIDYSLQRMLPAVGIATFVYDKRGTGKSGGKYTQDYSLLADDVVAAVQEAKRLAGTRLGRIGLQGGSQAGWIEPLAANRTTLDFVIVCFGLAVNVIDEDQQAIELQMREKGYPPEVIAHALQVGSAVEDVFASGFKDGFKELDTVRGKYSQESWYKDVRGDYSWILLPRSDAELKAHAKDFDWQVAFHYDPMPPLRANKTPQLWILGGEDYEAPSAETSLRIQTLIAERGPFTLAYYPKAEHGMTLFEMGTDGERHSTRYVPDYFAMIRDFARDGQLQGTYGDAVLISPRS
jgi:uncharacterized protein